MCGICGFTGRGSSEDIEAMTSLMFHRGPDARGMWHDPLKAVYMGHRRLAIIDIEGGAQPMWSGDDTLGIVFNGEIYNHMELRERLQDRGHVFQSDHSDTEMLLHGFREWGSDLPNHLNGMWAFAIYDRTREILFLSRDRFGKKPLFYTLQNRTFAFASELTALTRHSAIRASVCPRSLKKYFAYAYIPAPCSLYKQIYKLPGGHSLCFDLKDFSLKIWKYWDFILEPFDKIPKHPEEEWGEQIRELLRKAVERRLMSDVPLGVFLSGGIDSSAITAFAAQILGSGNLKTFSIGFEEKSFDESPYAELASELFQTDHHLEMLSMESAAGLLPEIFSRLDEPMGDGSLLPTYLLCQETRRHVTVALGGDGGDELFAGYDPFHALRAAELYKSLFPGPVHKAIRMAMGFLPVSHGNISLDFKIRQTLKGLSYPRHLWNAIWMGALEPAELEELFREPADIEDIYSEAIECWENCPRNNLVDKALQFYTKLYLQNAILVKADRASMMNSLEVRSPFLDAELADFARRIPHSWKYRRGESKYILKKALEPLLPKEILYRRKKGFGAPIGRWLRHGFIELNSLDLPQMLDRDFIEKMNREHLEGKADHRAFLWNLWVLGLKKS